MLKKLKELWEKRKEIARWIDETYALAKDVLMMIDNAIQTIKIFLRRFSKGDGGCMC